MGSKIILVSLLMVERVSLACLSVQVYSEILGSLRFDMLATVPEGLSKNAYTYKSSGRQVYHSVSESELQKKHYYGSH